MHYKGHWKGWALKIKTFLCSEMATNKISAILAQKSWDGLLKSRLFLPWNGKKRSERHLDPQQLRFSGPTPSNGPSNAFARIKIVKANRHIKIRYIGNFIYMSFCILHCVFCILYFVLWTLYYVSCILYSVFCILYSVVYAVSLHGREFQGLPITMSLHPLAVWVGGEASM